MDVIRKHMVRLAVVVVLAASAAHVRADSQALIGWAGDNGYASWVSDRTLGWKLAVTSSVTVAALGLWDLGADGLFDTHRVAIWTAAGVPTAADATVAAGSNASEWKWVQLPGAVTLAPGDYVIGAYYPASRKDYVHTRADTVMTDPRITWVGGRSSSGLGFAFPDADIGYPYDAGVFGPNFMIKDPAPVPEPALIQIPALMAFGGAGMWWRRRIRERRPSLDMQ